MNKNNALVLLVCLLTAVIGFYVGRYYERSQVKNKLGQVRGVMQQQRNLDGNTNLKRGTTIVLPHP